MNAIFKKRFASEPAFVAAGAAQALLEFVAPQSGETEFACRVRAASKPQAEMLPGGVAVVPVVGALIRKPDALELIYGGIEDTSEVQTLLEGVIRDPAVKGILLNIDSPGGFVVGVPEVAELVRTSPKPTVTWCGGTMASAAYWIGSQADLVFSSKSAVVGSVGAYTVVLDVTELYKKLGVEVQAFTNSEGDLKTTGLPGLALSEVQRNELQRSTQAAFDSFKSEVLNVRPNIPSDAMRGQTFSGQEAKSAGLVDAVGSLGYALTCLRRMI
jgi:signal peptide peptidase SppA